MPRAPKKCPKVECHNRQPCSVHPMGWGAKRFHNTVKDSVKKRIRARQVCALCGQPGWEVDHIIPTSQGGTDDLTNLRLLCHSCHKSKSDEEKNWRHRNG